MLMMVFLPQFLVLASPTVGYLLGTAVTLLPDATDLTLAPLYGTMLGIVPCIFLSGRVPNTFDDSSFGLLNNDEVKKEIKLTHEQKARAIQLFRRIQREDLEQIQQQLLDISDEARKELNQELSNKIWEETYKGLAEILNPEQMDRYKQIDLQAFGINAFILPDVQKTLKLNLEQKGKIQAIVDNFQKECQDRFLAKGKFGSFKAILLRGWSQEMVKQRVLSRQLQEKVAADLFDREQMTIWRSLTGEPFKGWRIDSPWGD